MPPTPPEGPTPPPGGPYPPPPGSAGGPTAGGPYPPSPGGPSGPGGPGQMPPMGYGGQPGGSPQYSPGDAVRYGWEGFKANLGPFLGVTLVLAAVMLIIDFGTQLAVTGSLIQETDPMTGLPENPVGVLGNLVLFGSSLVVTVISFVLSAGLYRAALDVADSGRADIGTMFTRIPWLQLILVSILVSLITIVGIILCIIPGIIAAFLLYYSQVAVVDGHSAIDGLKASFEMVKDNVGPILVLTLIFIGLAILALCTLGIAYLVLIPVSNIAVAYTWRTLSGRPPVAVA